MGSSTRTVCILVLLGFQLGWRMAAGECIPAQDLAEVARCCRKEHYVPKDVAQSCYERAIAEGHDESSELIICLLTCAYETMGIMTEGGEVDEGKYMQYLANIEESFRKVVISGVRNCSTNSEEIKRNARNVHIINCNVYPAAFHMCVSEYTTEHCPANRYHASPVCDKVRAGILPC